MKVVEIEVHGDAQEAQSEIASLTAWVVEKGGRVEDTQTHWGRREEKRPDALILVHVITCRMVVRVPDAIEFGHRYRPRVLQASGSTAPRKEAE